MKLSYRNNKSIINSILFGLIYLFAGIALDKNLINEILISVVIILPGLIFPLITLNFRGKNKINSPLFLAASCVIYYEAAMSYFFNDHLYNLLIFGTFLSSILYQFLLKYFFKAKTPTITILIVAILSGLSFLPLQLTEWNYTLLGFGMFLWLIINSIIPNNQYYGQPRI